MLIRKFEKDDIPAIIEILELNGQYTNPRIDGAEAMIRVSENYSSVFLVSETDGKVVGVIRGVYDGSRAQIHVISVHPNWQKRGIGTSLVKEISREFKKMGAPSLSVTAANDEELNSIPFFKKLAFEELPVKLAVHFDIDKLIGE